MSISGKSKKKSFSPSFLPIIGIGASAGGLEAILKLLENLPCDTGFAIVIIMHLDPKVESSLTQILGRATPMSVVQIKNNLVIESNHIYTIPPKCDVKLSSNGKFKVIKRNPKILHLPIDLFFISLAEQRKERSIGVILSGTGSDGTLGLAAIRAEGGITFVQKPSSAKHKTMPANAIRSGTVDAILIPKELGKEIARIGAHPYIKSPLMSVSAKESSEKNPFEDLPQAMTDELGNIITTLYKVTHIDFAQYKTGTLQRRIKRRMILCKINNIKMYVDYISKSIDEAKALADDFLISVTRFFRDPKAFETLKNRIFPYLLKNHASNIPFRVWVPGCASGEEAYSIVILLLELLEKKNFPIQIKVFATDISEIALKKARAGFFPDGIIEDIGKVRLQRYFHKVDGGFRISKEVRDLCIFSRHDVTRDPPFAKIDFLSCRNLLIYFNSMLQKQVLSILNYALNETGILLLGRSEAAAPHSNLFVSIDKKLSLYSKKETAVAVKDKLNTSSLTIKRMEPFDRDMTFTDNKVFILKEADRLLLEKYAPPSVLINTHMDIIMTWGNISLYLRLSSGQPRLNIMKMASLELAMEIRQGIQAIKKLPTINYEKHISFQDNESTKNFTLRIQTLRLITYIKEIYYLITFEKPFEQNNEDILYVSRKDKKNIQVNSFSDHQYQLLLEQFETSQEAMIAANEDLQSSNEELQSTNEELVTTKEELESSNEELSTVNEELRLKNIEITHLNADLNNFLANINVPIIFVDNNKRIRNFTPNSSRIIKLIVSDVGRSFGDFSSQIKGVNLDHLLSEVIDTMTEKSLEIKDEMGCWHKLIVKPYSNSQNTIDGAIVILLNINDLKNMTENLKKSYEDAKTIISTLPIPLLLIKQDLKISLANNAFCKTFQISAKEVIGKTIPTLGNGQWNIPELISLINRTFSENINFTDFAIEHDFPLVGRKSILLNVTLVSLAGSGEKIALLAIHDMTHRKEEELG